MRVEGDEVVLVSRAGLSAAALNVDVMVQPPACGEPFCCAVFTGAFWVILRVLFGLMWLGILCGPLIM